MTGFDRGKRLLIGVTSFLLAACVAASTIGSGPRAQPDEDYWNALRVPGANEVEDYGSFGDMAASADLIVRGRLGTLEVGRIIRGDAEEDVVAMTSAGVFDAQILAGTGPTDGLAVEFLAPFPATSVQGILDRANAASPSGDVLLFLRDKGGAESGIFRLVSATGLWEINEGRPRAPLAEANGLGPNHRFAGELTDVSSFDGLITLVENRL